MNNVDRDIQRKLRALRHPEQIGTFPRPTGILELAGLVFIAREPLSSARGRLAW